VENGTIIGTTVEGSPNTFLTKGLFKDFELQFEVKVDDQLNSGVQVRSHLAKEGDPAPEGSKSCAGPYSVCWKNVKFKTQSSRSF
jgi:hypothetical protein